MFNDFKILNSFTLENSFFARYTEAELEQITVTIQTQLEKRANGDNSKGSGKWEQILEKKKQSPRYIYESVQGCYHFTAADHEKLGSDTCLVMH